MLQRYGSDLFVPTSPRHPSDPVAAIVEQLTTIWGCEVSSKLEIDMEVPGGLGRYKALNIMEKVVVLGLIDNDIGQP